MDISTINELIDELENSETSLSNVRNLSALYTVKAHLLGTPNYDTTAKELNDILPSYLQYIDVKKQYQLHKTTETGVHINMEKLCQEIKEFIQTLYNNTDTKEERNIIKNMLKEVQ